MSSENDVPLGEGSSRYYEQQFGERIRQVSKSGGTPKPSSGGGSNWNGRAGIGIGLGVLFVVIRIILAFARTDSSTPSYTYKPPEQLKFDADAHFQKQLKDLIVQAEVPVNPQQNALLQGDDIPLLEGLCYRIHQESLRPEPTPGSRIRKFLDEATWKLLVTAAEGLPLSERKEHDLIDALNSVLKRQDFYDVASFGAIAGIRIPLDGQMEATNREILEKSYPAQIVPLRERGDLTPEQWLTRAQADLEKAKKEQAKH